MRSIRVLELFAGIGAFSKALTRQGIPHEIVDAVEIDKYAIKSFNAIHRLQERRSLTHLTRHIDKIQKWNLPDTGETEHKGYRYITREGVLITVLPPTREFMQRKAEES